MRKFTIVISIFILIALDMWSKWFFTGAFQGIFFECYSSDCIYRYFPIFGEWIGITVAYNSGIAFSLPIRGLLLQSLTVILIIGLIYQYIHKEYPKHSPLLDVGYTLILAGAFSHAYERIFMGHVIDFIAVKNFAILNLADILIFIGAFFLFFAYGLIHRKHR